MKPDGSSPHSQIPPPLSALRQLKQTSSNGVFVGFPCIPLNAELNPICHLLALLAGASIVVVSRLRVNKLRGAHHVTRHNTPIHNIPSLPPAVFVSGCTSYVQDFVRLKVTTF